MSVTLQIRSLSLVNFFFDCVEVGFDVSQFLAIVVDSVVPGLAPASLIVRRCWTSPATNRTKGRAERSGQARWERAEESVGPEV